MPRLYEQVMIKSEIFFFMNGRISIGFICSLFLSTLLSAQVLDTASYSVGLSLGLRLKSQGAKSLDYESLIKGIDDVLSDNEWIITREESDSINYEYFQNQRNNMFQKIKEEGETFLAENAKRPEVTVLESGLQYEVLIQGAGDKPGATSNVTVHYSGFLINGTMFDSSVERGEPVTFPLNRVIQGWTEGLQHMSVGSKYKLFIPSDLGYGSRGAGADIPPYSTLIFEVELLDFK